MQPQSAPARIARHQGTARGRRDANNGGEEQPTPVETTQAPAPTQQAAASPAAARPARAESVFLPIIGAPVQAVTPLSKQLGASAPQSGPRDQELDRQNSDHILKGYFSALNDGGKTTVVYVWDILDGSGQSPAPAIQGQDSVANTAADPWSRSRQKRWRRSPARRSTPTSNGVGRLRDSVSARAPLAALSDFRPIGRNRRHLGRLAQSFSDIGAFAPQHPLAFTFKDAKKRPISSDSGRRSDCPQSEWLTESARRTPPDDRTWPAPPLKADRQ